MVSHGAVAAVVGHHTDDVCVAAGMRGGAGAAVAAALVHLERQLGGQQVVDTTQTCDVDWTVRIK